MAEGTPEKVAGVEASHTGRALKAVLERDPRAERTVYEPGREVVTEDTALETAEIGEARMPWEADGRAWHTRDRVGHRGEPVRWEGAALEWVIDLIEAAGRKFFAPTDWSSRGTVEIKAPSSSAPWFFHARTAHPWLLDLNFRVPTRAFSAAEVRRLVPLKILDDCDELPIYGRQPRVTVRHSGTHTDDVRILIHRKTEIATRGGREFIKRACKAYERLIRRLARDVAARQPWKTNGRQWHLGQQAVPKSRPKLWSGGLIAELLGRLKRLDTRIQPQWDRKVMVVVEHPAVEGPWLRLVTNHGDALRVEVRAGCGRITPAMVDRVGLEVEIQPRRGGEDQVRFWLQRMVQCDLAQFDRLVRESIDSLTSAKEQTQ